MLGLIVEILIAVAGSSLGSFAAPAILAIASLQAIFIFLVYMHGRFGPRPVAGFAVISLITVVPLLIGWCYSVVMPHHGSLAEEMKGLAGYAAGADVVAGIAAGIETRHIKVAVGRIAPGSYYYICPVAGHRQKGMIAPFIVQSGC